MMQEVEAVMWMSWWSKGGSGLLEIVRRNCSLWQWSTTVTMARILGLDSNKKKVRRARQGSLNNTTEEFERGVERAYRILT